MSGSCSGWLAAIREPQPPCPFPGMAAYGQGQADVFFGRDADVSEVVDRMQRRNCVALVGPSASGKSSLLSAGVVPVLRQSGWSIVVTRPGRHPMGSLAAAMAQLLRVGDVKHRLLVVDQLEEVFGSEPTEGEAFIHALLGERDRIAVAVAVRADFYGQVMTSPLWPMVRDHRFDVLPLGGDQLEAAVIGPCDRVGVYIEPALVDRLRIDAADEPGRLPLLQETLVLLWNRLDRRYLPLRAYEALVLPRTVYGREPRTGLQVALARHADATLAELSETDRQVARRVFIQLVQFGVGRQDVRRQCTLAELRAGDDNPEEVERVVRHLDAARLITLGSGLEGDSTPVVDLAHEAIITAWPALADWIREHRAAEHQRRWLADRSDEWRAGGGNAGLLDDVQLAQAEAWLAGPDPVQVGAGSAITAFVTASRARVDAEHRRREVAARRLRMLTVLLAILLVASVGAAAAAVIQAGRATDQRLEAHAAALAHAAASQPLAEVDTGLLLGVGGTQLRQSAEAEGGLFAALTVNPRVRHVVDIGAPIVAMAASPDGDWVAVAAETAITLVDVEQAKVDRLLESSLEGQPRSVAVSPDGQLLAVGTSAGELLVWRLDDLDRGPSEILDLAASVRAVTFSPDSAWIAAGDSAGAVSLLPVNAGNPRRLDGHRDWVNAIVFTPDGQRLVSGSGEPGVEEDTRVLVHDLRGDTPPMAFEGHRGAVRSIAISPDGSTVASSDGQGVVEVWNLTDGGVVGTLVAHDGSAYDVAFDPAGERLVTGGRDHAVRLWDIDTMASEGEPLVGHALAVRAVVYSQDDTVVSAGIDGKIVLWDLAARPYPRLTTALDDQPSDITAVVSARDGERVATGSADGRVIVRAGATGQPVGPEIGLDARVQALTFSADGEQLLTADRSGRLALWSLPDGRLLADRRDLFRDTQADWLLTVTAGPDGTFASGDTTGAIRLWLWDGQLTADPRTMLQAHRSWVTGLAYAGPDRLREHGSRRRRDDLGRTEMSPPSPTQRRRNRGQFTGLTTTESGLIVVGDSDDRLVVLNPDGKETGTAFAHTGDVVAAAAAGDGVVTGDRDGTLALWAVKG